MFNSQNLNANTVALTVVLLLGLILSVVVGDSLASGVAKHGKRVHASDFLHQ